MNDTLGKIRPSGRFGGLFLPEHLQGFARGYNERADLITQTLDGADLNAMWDEFQKSLQLLQRYQNQVIALLTYEHDRAVERVMLPPADEFEEATQYGQPKGIRPPTHTPVGFDYRDYDVAIRYTFDYLANATANDLRGLNNAALEADIRLQFSKILRQVFRNTTRNFTLHTDLVDAVTVFPFYNNDGTVPPKWKTYTHLSTHNHYLTSGAAAIVSGDLDDMEDHLYHHGYGVQGGSRLILLVNRAEGKVIRKFTAPTDSYDFIPSPNVGGGVIQAQGTIIGRPQGELPGQIGTYGPWHVLEEDMLPAKYVFGFATGGERSLSNPIGVRIHENAGLRGLKLVKGPDNDYPLTDSYYRHGFGTGVRHRGGGVVMEITADATYDIPAGY